MNPELPYVVGFSKVLEIGPVKFSQIKSLFGSAVAAWQAPIGKFAPLNFHPKIISSLEKVRKETDVEKEVKRCAKLGVTVLTPEDLTYPKLLKEIYDPPFILYVRGHLKTQDEVSLAVVGSRRMTAYGYSAIESLVPPLCQAGLTIVSGLAFGVDAAAHKAVIGYGGRALAVLASGVDQITPVSNSQIGLSIINNDQGAVISEFPLGTEPQPFYFPRRNRIISGLSRGVLVVEAAEKSGALITARAALEQGREVFAVPASIFNPVGVGTNRLIQEGAKMVTDPSDILEELGVAASLSAAVAKSEYPSTAEETQILSAFTDEECHVDELVRAVKKSAAEVAGALTLLEIKGMVKNVGNGYYRRVN